jgi:type 1 fimbria pilin
VGNDKPRKTFTLKNSNCVNASGVTLKLTSTKAAYDNSGLSILANTTTGTSAAGGRGVAVSYEDRPGNIRRMTQILQCPSTLVPS